MDDYDETESRSSTGDSDEGDSSSLADVVEGPTLDTTTFDVSHDDTDAYDDASTSDATTDASLSDLANSLRERRPRGGESEVAGDRTTRDWNFVHDINSTERESSGTVDVDSGAGAVLDQVEDETTLLVGPGGPVDDRLCERLMSPESTVTNHHQLVISVDVPPAEQRDTLQRLRSGAVHSQALVDAQSYSVSGDVAEYEGVEVMNVASPRDLRRIGILTTKVLSKWNDAGVPISICFHSLSNLLDAVGDTQRVFRFLHILHGRIRAAGGRAHFHLDPTRHDEQTVRTFYSLFDAVVEFDADGSVTLV
ncbi:hypothetical protein GJR96_07215 [Haloferax sp. MBLA0076]|uniref:KaiC-like domain-containing protein n=1 Tax=Haloferax litoreum TaxID=2666140 RepID=A0A6A8GEC1_9EURY|nr:MULTISPECIES: hypothetical protein [Haloferax]KAB1193245.1 hypothetical protein Hfx1148_07210 [Haloferax sp. CBA1148]MRX21744.1 hypothetical protein [Haloferax litoreum]